MSNTMFQNRPDQLARMEGSNRIPVLLTEEQYLRAQACVNACQGITTKSLEENGVASMEQALGLCNKIDRLAVALKDIVKSLSDQDDEGMIEHTDQMIAARAALALVNAPF